MKTVIVYRSDLLRLSETFIKEQVRAYRRWHGILMGMRSIQGLQLDGLDFRLLRPDHPSFVDRIYWKIYRMRGSAPPSVIKMLKSEAASLFHVHFGIDAVEAWPLAQGLNLPMLVTLHGYDINIKREWWEAGHGGPALKDYPARLLNLAREPHVRFIAVSNFIRQQAIEYGLPRDKISVHYIGVDTRQFRPSGRPIAERERRVLFVGRLVEKKGCEYLIRAFKQVQQKVPDASLVIVGDGELREQIRELAQQLDVRANFRGALSSVEVRRELSLARVFCLPSVTAANGDAEGLGIALLEAQASGVPVVTSARGGAEEAVWEGVTGFTFQERDVDALTEKLVTLLSDDDIMSSMASAAPRFIAETFDICHCTEMLEISYDGMLL
jgi:glycosyltransferase involved in cell wall biosynthesis